MELQQGKYDATQAHLERARPNLADISSTWTAFNYYETLGQLHRRRGNLLESETAPLERVAGQRTPSQVAPIDADRLAWERDAGRAYRTLVEIMPDGLIMGLARWRSGNGTLAQRYVVSRHRPLPKHVSPGTWT